MMKRRAGFTLLELLISIGIMAAVTAGIVEIMSIGLGYSEKLRAGRPTEDSRVAFEDRITELIHHIYIDPVNATNPSTFFVGQAGIGMPPGQTVQPGEVISATPTPAGNGGQVAAPAGAPSAGTTGAGADTLMFTSMGRKIPDAVLGSTDDFETQNTNFGPQGGVAEYALSLTAVGDTKGKTGLVLRSQIPADQDATQGGNEEIIEPDVTQINFQFFDGTTWQPSWNTFSQTPRQLPNAIRIDYTLKGETNDHILIIGIPSSKVTPNNPATQTGGS